MDRAEYENAYPHYCKDCRGWGMTTGFSPDFHFSDYVCVESGSCPRCGEQSLDDMHKCANCGWDICDESRGLPGGTPIPGTKCMMYPED